LKSNEEWNMLKKLRSTYTVYLLAALVSVGSAVPACAQASNALNSATTAALNGGASASADKPNASPVVPTTAAKLHDESFIIGVDDVLAINVWKEAEISRSVPVRSDGKISLPLVGEVTAAGETPKRLEDEIAKKLENYISEPEVTVIVQEIRSQRFNILGLVARPGSYALGGPITVLDAIALAGGFRDFAKQKSIYVLRQNGDGSQTRLAFNYKDVIKGRNSTQNVKLEPRDTVVVP
jgi:polysaccharide export outer membrane protein